MRGGLSYRGHSVLDIVEVWSALLIMLWHSLHAFQTVTGS